MSEQQELPPGAFDNEMESAVKDAVKIATDEMLSKTSNSNDTSGSEESQDQHHFDISHNRSGASNADISTNNVEQNKHDEDGRDFALNQAIEDAIRVNFGNTRENKEQEPVDESHTDASDIDDKMKKDEEVDQTSELEAAEMDLNREIKNAFQESGVVGEESQSDSGSESEASTEYSVKEASKEVGNGTQDMQEAIYDALREVEANAREKKSVSNEADDSIAQLELNKAIEEALNVPIAEESAAYKDKATTFKDHEEEAENDDDDDAANVDLSTVVNNGLKGTEISSIAKDDNTLGTDSNSNAEDNALKQALEQVAQNVVDTALEPEKKDKDDAEKVSESSGINNEESGDQQWDDIMLKAMEMATENPEALLSSLNANSNVQGLATATRNSVEVNKSSVASTIRTPKLPNLSFPFNATPNERRSVSALAQSMVNAAISAAAMRAAAQQRLMELTGQRNVENLSGKDFLSAYQKYVSSRKAGSTPSPFNRPIPSSATSISSRFNLPSVFDKSANTQIKGQQRKKNMSIAEVLALERRRMGLVAPSVEDMRATSSKSSTLTTGDSGASSVERQSLLGFILSSVNLEAIDPDIVSSKLSPEIINKVKQHVNSAASKIMAEELLENENKQDLDELEKRKLENRERKKRWRVINIERNRDNDLRIRVTKKANNMYPAPEQAVEKQNWITAEFNRRKQKRMLREQAQQRELLGLELPSVASSSAKISHSTSLKNKSIAEILSDEEFLKRISAVCNSIGIKIDVDGLKQSTSDKVVAVTALGIGVLVSYIASTPTLSVSNLEVIISSVVNSLRDFIDYGSKTDAQPLRSLSINPAPMAYKASTTKRSLPTPFVPTSKQISNSQPPTKKVAFSKAGSPMKSRVKHKKKSRSKSQKDQPVDFKKFMSPHPLPASFWSKIKEKKIQGDDMKTEEKGKNKATNSMERSSQLSEHFADTMDSNQSKKTSISDVPHSENTKANNIVNISSSKVSHNWDFITSVTSSSIKAVKLPKYMKPKIGKNKEEEPHMSSIHSVYNIAKGHESSESSPSVGRPSYYGIRKPAAFRKPTAFTKSDDLERMRESLYKIVPLKPQ